MPQQKKMIVAVAATFTMLLGGSVLVVGPTSIKKAATEFKYTSPTSPISVGRKPSLDEKLLDAATPADGKSGLRGLKFAQDGENAGGFLDGPPDKGEPQLPIDPILPPPARDDPMRPTPM